MTYSKVVNKDTGEVYLDLSGDTVTQENVVQGKKFINSAGEIQTGTMTAGTFKRTMCNGLGNDIYSRAISSCIKDSSSTYQYYTDVYNTGITLPLNFIGSAENDKIIYLLPHEDYLTSDGLKLNDLSKVITPGTIIETDSTNGKGCFDGTLAMTDTKFTFTFSKRQGVHCYNSKTVPSASKLYCQLVVSINSVMYDIVLNLNNWEVGSEEATHAVTKVTDTSIIDTEYANYSNLYGTDNSQLWFNDADYRLGGYNVLLDNIGSLLICNGKFKMCARGNSIVLLETGGGSL